MPEQTKEEYMTQCKTSGKTDAECEMMWTDSQKQGDKAKDWTQLVREVEMERAKNSQLSKLLKEATDIIKAVNAERDAVTDARKYELAAEIERDSEGRLHQTDLMKESLQDLTLRKQTIDSARPKDFVSTAALLEEHDSKKAPQLTVGEWDPIAKKWKGGV